MFDFSYEKTRESVEISLENLNVQYFDVVFVHDVEFADDIEIILNETLPALKEMKEEGKIEHIGISGYSLSYLKEILDASAIRIDYILTYARYTLSDESLLDFLPEFKKKDVKVLSASPTAMGLLTESGPQVWHPAPGELKINSKNASQFCKKKGFNLATLAVKYAFSNKDIDCVIVGAKNLVEFQDCFESFKNEITSNEHEIIKEIKQYFWRL